jgi:hypothetical protein
MSTPRNEFASTVDAVRGEDASPEASEDLNDPLGAYIDEVDDASSTAAKTNKPDAAAEDEDEFDDFEDDDWDFDDLEEEAEASKSESKAADKEEIASPSVNGSRSAQEEKKIEPEVVSPAPKWSAKTAPAAAKAEIVPMKEQSSPTKKKGASPYQQESGGALTGWLISFEDSKGVANELRVGKFFVSGGSLKATDLVLKHPSVSTPHALVTVSTTGITVQDLMSESGISIQRAGEKAFRKADEVSSLSHGDKVRFGEVEFLVSCLPGICGA